MKKFALLILLSSCQWIVTHPQEDEAIILSVEELAKEAYEYETKTLSPAPPLPNGLPPFKQVPHAP